MLNLKQAISSAEKMGREGRMNEIENIEQILFKGYEIVVGKIIVPPSPKVMQKLKRIFNTQASALIQAGYHRHDDIDCTKCTRQPEEARPVKGVKKQG